MFDPTATSTLLLQGLHDEANHEVWAQFDRRYRPILMAFARRLGLSEADAADVAQETMARFLEEYRAGKYDRQRGRLRSWIISLARTRVAQVYRRRDRNREVAGISAAADLDDDQRLTQIWEDERRRVLLREAMQQLREATKTNDKTIRAFELLVFNQLTPADVARQLQITPQDVYRAKNRVAQRLQEILDQLEQAYDDR